MPHERQSSGVNGFTKSATSGNDRRVAYLIRQVAHLRAHSDGSMHVPLFAFDVFEPGPTSRAQAVSRLFDTTQEARVMFEAVLEPVLFRLESDQHACWLAMARNNDLLRLGFSKEARQVILDLG